MDLLEPLIGLAGICVASGVGCILVAIAMLVDLAWRSAWLLLIIVTAWQVLVR